MAIGGIRIFSKFREVNRRFSRPHVKMTPAVKIALLMLRIYLLLLVAILAVKFATLVAGR